MKVPFHLRRLSAAKPATALLFPGRDVGELIALCMRLGSDPLPGTFRVRDGFLLKLPRPASAACAGAIRLRGLAENFFVPVDAELVPILLDDEARGLVRDRGLVFLPGGRVLEFAPGQALKPADLLNVGAVRRQSWQAFPPAPPRIDHVRSILLDIPDDLPDVILETGGEGIGSEAPRPEDSGLPAQVLGQAALGAGKALVGLGGLLGMQSLANLGAKWIESALAMVPRLSESLLGRQESALRALLREFREGSLERALRRALPLGGEGGRGGSAYTGDQLPTHQLWYSLRNILGSKGPASIWFGGYEVQRELEQEYKKAAEHALGQGDTRRAAFIYGKLLHDYRKAADVLFQGGLFRDAGVLYLNKLNDPRSAARAFEAAGEIDRALQIYRQLGEYILAGDMLRRAGEEEAAFVEYRTAANRSAASGDFLAAAEVMWKNALRPDLALEYLQEGWKRRPIDNAVPCALRLARLHAEQAALPPIRQLMTEGRQFFAPPGNEVAAGQFFNGLAALAVWPALAEVKDELRDQSLTGLALKLKQRAAVEARPGNVVSSLLGRPGIWPEPLVSDAQFALKAALARPQKETAQPRSSATQVRIGTGRITAACSVGATGDLVVGFASGEIVCFHPKKSELAHLPHCEPQPLLALAASFDGQVLSAFQGQEEFAEGNKQKLFRFWKRADGRYHLLSSQEFQESADVLLSPSIVKFNDDYLLGLWDGAKLQVHHGPFSTSREDAMLIYPESGMVAAVLVPVVHKAKAGVGLLLLDADFAYFYSALKACLAATEKIGWQPSIPKSSSLLAAPLSWIQYGHEFELAGINSEGTFFWSKLLFDGTDLKASANYSFAREEGYGAATILSAGTIAAVTKYRVDWLRGGTQRLVLHNTTQVALPDVVACFPSYPTSELLILSGDGWLERLPFVC